ncbi:hypothetical protein BKK80_00330 [Cupriavidus malaysiensis]|uniref:Uncharacterized protein n=1 Tax=Cupriavidus malaysiensis TaxID=367825 RepID=A0ABM6EZH9_9BURK|nr:hypothetical protein BKK80_00330 [Cupriavidus malaysiensis]
MQTAGGDSSDPTRQGQGQAQARPGGAAREESACLSPFFLLVVVLSTAPRGRARHIVTRSPASIMAAVHHALLRAGK